MDDQDLFVVSKDFLDELFESFGADDRRFGFSERGDEELKIEGEGGEERVQFGFGRGRDEKRQREDSRCLSTRDRTRTRSLP